MKKRLNLSNLDCANCAAKMERAIQRIDGVHAASVNFLTQRLTLDAEEERFDAILGEMQSVCRRIEPGCKLVLGE